MYTRIKQVLDYSGLNQQEFSDRIAISPATLSNILKGKTAKYNVDLLMSIRSSFPAINFEWLLTGEGPMLNSDVSSSPSVVSGAEPSSVQNDPFQDGLFAGMMPTPAALDEPYSSAQGGSSAPQSVPSGGLSPQADLPSGGASMGVPRSGQGYPTANGAAEGIRNNTETYPSPHSPHGTSPYPSSRVPASAAPGNRNGGRAANRQVSYLSEGYSPVTPPEMALKYSDNYRRSIKEIRVFFDDDTFEVFVPLRTDSKIK